MTQAIDASELCRLSTPTDLAVSPDGTQVAFTATEWNEADDERHTALYVVPTDGSAEPHRLSRVSDAGAPRWSPDGRMLGFVGTREEDLDRRVGPVEDAEEEEEAAEDDDPEPQVWAFDLDRGGDAVQLTDRDWGVREFDWGPAGDRIVISARDPTEEQAEYLEALEDDGPVELERLQHKLDGVGFTDDVTTYLFVVDLETGASRRLDGTAAAGAMEPMVGISPAWAPDGDRVAYLTADAERPDDTTVMEVHLVDVATGSVERVTDLDAMLSQPAWSPSGDRLVVSGRDAENWYRPSDVFVVDPSTGSATVLTDGLDATVSWFGFPRFVGEETVVAGLGDAGRTRLYRFAADGSSVEPVELGFDADVASLRTLDVGGDTLAFVRSDPSAGDDVFAVSADGSGEPTRLSAQNEAFMDEHPQPGIVQTVSPSDEVEVESMVYHPDSFDPDDPSPHPTIVWTHGGPMSYDDPEFGFHFSYFTSRGYLIVKPNYRGSTSYGRDFAEVLKGAWGTVEVDDTLAVVDDLVERGWIDTDRLFATGFSYGGILTGFLITRTDRFTAAAAEHGIYDLRSEFGTSDSHVWLGNEYGVPWHDGETYDDASSLLEMGGVDTPTLVTAGSEDWRCPPSQSEQLYVSLRKQDVPARLVVYRGENHDVSAPERAIHRLEELAGWFERHDPTRPDESA